MSPPYTNQKVGRVNILVEGIDGSGKDEFVARLVRIMKSRYEYSPEATISVVGQPAFKFDSDGVVRALIERGEVLVSAKEAKALLKENRRCHEEYLKRYNGVVFCLRGILTEMATLARLFDETDFEDLGQTRPIDILVVVDADPDVAYKRILSRNRPPDWRETPEHLSFFRNFYLSQTNISYVRECIVFENMGSLEDMDTFAASLADRIEKIWK